MSKLLLSVSVIIVLNGCISTTAKHVATDFTFPIQAASDEIVVYVARDGRYGSVWEYFSLELNGEYKILNADDCNYFIIKENKFTMRSKKNIQEYPIAELNRKDLNFGKSYYFLQVGNGRDHDHHFKEVTAEDISPICKKYGFGRVMNNPPNSRWGKNDLKNE